jgi:hypothetical protein
VNAFEFDFTAEVFFIFDSQYLRSWLIQRDFRLSVDYL